MLTTVDMPRRTMLRMAQIHKIHAGKTPHRIHFIPEWAAKRQMRQADIINAFPPEMNVNKSTVSRWFKGSLPDTQHLAGLAAIFETEVSSLFRHPDDDWIAKFFRERSEDERDRAIAVLKALFQNPHTGTDG